MTSQLGNISLKDTCKNHQDMLEECILPRVPVEKIPSLKFLGREMQIKAGHEVMIV